MPGELIIVTGGRLGGRLGAIAEVVRETPQRFQVLQPIAESDDLYLPRCKGGFFVDKRRVIVRKATREMWDELVVAGKACEKKLEGLHEQIMQIEWEWEETIKKIGRGKRKKGRRL